MNTISDNKTPNVSGLKEAVSAPTLPRCEATPRIESGLLGAGFWAKCGKVYAGGYRTERGARNAVQRKLDDIRKLYEARQSFLKSSPQI